MSIAGIEVEYALVIEGGGGEKIDPRPMTVQMVAQYPSVFPGLNILSCGSATDAMLSNGARFYDDLGHPEYSTPECGDLTSLVACDKAGELLMRACCETMRDRLPEGWIPTLYKNNTDYAGHTWGCHENYLISSSLFEKLIVQRGPELYQALIPFLTSRQIISGAGRVGGENGWIGYQLSQRADFIRTAIGLETTTNRPIVNTRDEALADRSRFRRLHLVMGDTNLAEFSTFLKIGTTRLVLRMLEQGFYPDHLALRDPVAAFQSVSRNPFAPVSIYGDDVVTAVDIQSAFLEMVIRFLDHSPADDEDRRVTVEWSSLLDAMRTDPLALGSKLDWAIKLAFLETIREQEGIGWDASLLKAFDIRYHNIHPGSSLFYTLQSQNRIQSILTDDSLVAHCMTNPPSNTRAHIRAQAIRDHHDQPLRVDWDYMDGPAGRLDWTDPGMH
ncbi:MAG: proteasome accessory factor PafA2 family protein [Anaerolineales bacterium]|nr:proteasome accessory factor PafA2 family protein [Anaerolineales bacterium]